VYRGRILSGMEWVGGCGCLGHGRHQYGGSESGIKVHSPPAFFRLIYRVENTTV
jgi:hypothetical protein